MCYLRTKSEDSGFSFSRSRDMKENQKQKMERLGMIGVIQDHHNVTILYSAHDFPFTFHRKYASIVYRF